MGVVWALPGGGLLVGVEKGDGGGGRELRLDVLGQLSASLSSRGGGGGGRESRLSVLPARSSTDGGEGGDFEGSRVGELSGLCSGVWGADFEGGGLQRIGSLLCGEERWAPSLGRLPCRLLIVAVPETNADSLSSVCDLRRLILAPEALPRLPTMRAVPDFRPSVS